MQRLVFAFLAGIAVLLISSGVHAELKMPLGKWNAAVKVDYLQFTDDLFDEELFYNDRVVSASFLGKDGAYIGLEAYANAWENMYVGAELGYVKTEHDFTYVHPYEEAKFYGGIYRYEWSNELEYIPVQLNVKYVLKPTENLICTFGGGISYNYAEISNSEQTILGSILKSEIESFDDWLFGGQVFAEILYTIDRYFVGISGGYQFTEDFDVDAPNFSAPNFNNYHIGGKIGFYF